MLLRIKEILGRAREGVARSVNTEMVRAYWLIGQEVVVEEVRGKGRADYGAELIVQLSTRLQAIFGRGFAPSNLRYMRLFHLTFPNLLDPEIHHALRDELAQAPDQVERPSAIGSGEATGRLNPELCWTHYRLLTKVESPYARAFYEIEAVGNRWSSRDLERQISSLLFERLGKSRDKQGLMELAQVGQQIRTPEDLFKDPVVLEFVGLPESHRLVETELEDALLTTLQAFLLELGKGFAFLSRQKRITLDGDQFYVDLVFSHVILKCYVLLDLKVNKLNHSDLGQMQFYVNDYDETQRTPKDNPTLGLILCADKNELMARYTLGEKSQRIFASRYKLHLPSEEDLANEIRRELDEASRLP